ncbi:FZR1 protein, partial [Polypterus senegalus]
MSFLSVVVSLWWPSVPPATQLTDVFCIVRLRGSGLERGAAVLRKPGSSHPAAGCAQPTGAERAPTAGSSAGSVRPQVVAGPPAPGVWGQRQQGAMSVSSDGAPWLMAGMTVLSFALLLQLFVWNNSSLSPVQQYTEHLAAVKAIAWSPHQHGLLASGGGTADRCIRFWNTLTCQPLQCVDTGSQVCNLAWSKHANELVSTHGYSQNQILVWKYPSLTQVAKLTGHSYRVLYLAISPDGEAIVTGAGDETLRFWNVFSKTRSTKGFHPYDLGVLLGYTENEQVAPTVPSRAVKLNSRSQGAVRAN